MLLSHKTQFSIQEAGKACDLNPSVLRIWEARYGWPKPQRRQNGYRIYDYQQIEELKRIAELVRQGHAISSLIKDGNPVIPRQHAPMESPYARLGSLPLPIHGEARRFHADLLSALRHQQYGAIRTLIERANWSLHPQQLLAACYLPVLVTLAETRRLPVGSPGNVPAMRTILQEAICARCRDLLARYPARKGAIALQPLEAEDECLALVAALGLNLAGVSASVVSHEPSDQSRLITVSDRLTPLPDRRHLGHLTALESERSLQLDQVPLCVQQLLRQSRSPVGVN